MREGPKVLKSLVLQIVSMMAKGHPPGLAKQAEEDVPGDKLAEVDRGQVTQDL